MGCVRGWLPVSYVTVLCGCPGWWMGCGRLVRSWRGRLGSVVCPRTGWLVLCGWVGNVRVVAKPICSFVPAGNMHDNKSCQDLQETGGCWPECVGVESCSDLEWSVPLGVAEHCRRCGECSRLVLSVRVVLVTRMWWFW